MKLITLTALFFISLSPQKSEAQAKTLDQLGQITQTGQKLKDLFGKKKNKPNSSSPQNSQADSATVLTAGSVLNRNSAGTVASNVKSIDVDEISYFSLGAAWVRKGYTTALIDGDGNLIVPFGKYNIAKEGLPLPGLGATGYCHGIFKAIEVNTNRNGYLNNHGVFFPLPAHGSSYGEMCGEYIATKTPSGSYIYYDRDWHSFPMAKPMGDFRVGNYREGLAVGYTAPQRYGAKLGYKNIQDHFVIAPQFDYADAFWEGRAIVGKIDQYGEMKYGYINKTGTPIFPCVLSNLPSRFSSGRARIEAKNNPDFDFAYIDSTGNIVIKRKNRDVRFGTFYKGYSISSDGTGAGRVLDTSGNVISLEHFLKRFGIESALYFKFPSSYEDPYYLEAVDDLLSDKIPFTVQPPNIDHQCQGFFDIRTRKVVNGVFETDHDIQFDKTVKLSYAKMQIGKGESGKPVFREGYINTDGIFVIIISAQSIF